MSHQRRMDLNTVVLLTILIGNKLIQGGFQTACIKRAGSDVFLPILSILGRNSIDKQKVKLSFQLR